MTLLPIASVVKVPAPSVICGACCGRMVMNMGAVVPCVRLSIDGAKSEKVPELSRSTAPEPMLRHSTPPCHAAQPPCSRNHLWMPIPTSNGALLFGLTLPSKVADIGIAAGAGGSAIGTQLLR